MGQAASVIARRRRVDGKRLLDAFAHLRPDLVQTLTLFLGSADDAQDVVQDAFLKCWRRRDRLRVVQNLRSWIFRVGLNAARDLQRNVWRRRSRPLTTQAVLDERRDASPSDQLFYRERLERLRVALGGLRPEEREVFRLRQNSDLTYDQIAARRRVPVGTVKTQMRSALLKLRAVLQETVGA
jgi:RNA polymerase sigma-70 factor (ECF subfamily)